MPFDRLTDKAGGPGGSSPHHAIVLHEVSCMEPWRGGGGQKIPNCGQSRPAERSRVDLIFET